MEANPENPVAPDLYDLLKRMAIRSQLVGDRVPAGDAQVERPAAGQMASDSSLQPGPDLSQLSDSRPFAGEPGTESQVDRDSAAMEGPAMAELDGLKDSADLATALDSDLVKTPSQPPETGDDNADTLGQLLQGLTPESENADRPAGPGSPERGGGERIALQAPATPELNEADAGTGESDDLAALLEGLSSAGPESGKAPAVPQPSSSIPDKASDIDQSGKAVPRETAPSPGISSEVTKARQTPDPDAAGPTAQSDLEQALSSLLDTGTPDVSPAAELPATGVEPSTRADPAPSAVRTLSENPREAVNGAATTVGLGQGSPVVEVELGGRLVMGGPQPYPLDVKILALGPDRAIIAVPAIDLIPTNVSHRLSTALPGAAHPLNVEVRVTGQRGELDPSDNPRQIVELDFAWVSESDREILASYYWSQLDRRAPLVPVVANVKLEVLEGPRRGTQFLGKSMYAAADSVQCLVDNFDLEPATQVRFSLIAPRFVEELRLEDGVVGTISPTGARRSEVQVQFASPHGELLEFVARHFGDKQANGGSFLSRFRH